MLESRLDETVLVEIESLLSRNPNCMLAPHDIHVSYAAMHLLLMRL